MTAIHGKFSPSQLPRIVRCPGSVQLCRSIPKRGESEYALEGTMLHEVLEECLIKEEFNLPSTIIAQYSLDQEQKEAVQDCLDWTFTLRMGEAMADDAIESIESTVNLGHYALQYNCPQLEEVYGTLDYSRVAPSLRKAWFMDWKFGKGVEVFPDSEQLKAYALGKLKTYEFAKQFDEIHLCIGQPRLYAGNPFKVEVVTPDELFAWLKERLVPALQDAVTADPSFHATEKGCMWCDAKIVCETRQQAAMEAAMEVFALHAKLPQVDVDHVSKVLNILPDLKTYISDIEQYATLHISAGKTLPGWKLVAGRSIRKWYDEEAAKKWFEEQYGFSEFDMSEMKFMSPAKAEKKLKKDIGKDSVKDDDFLALIDKPEGKPTLVPVEDRRPALEFQSVEEKFAEYAVGADTAGELD